MMNSGNISDIQFDLLMRVISTGEKGLTYTDLCKQIKEESKRLREKKFHVTEIDGKEVTEEVKRDRLKLFTPNWFSEYMKKLLKNDLIIKVKEPFLDKRKKERHRIVYKLKDFNQLVRFFFYTKGLVFEERQLFSNMNAVQREEFKPVYSHNRRIAKSLFKKDPYFFLEYAKEQKILYKMFITDQKGYALMITLTDSWKKKKIDHYITRSNVKRSKIEETFWKLDNYINRFHAEEEGILRYDISFSINIKKNKIGGK